MNQDRFRRSSFCTDAHGCVEVEVVADLVRVRDSKNPDIAPLMFDADEWKAFVQGVKAAEFDI